MKKIRLDQLVFDKGLAESRERAKAYIMAGSVYVNGQKETKPGTSVAEDAAVEMRGETLPYVSRGGWKLEKALRDFGVDVTGLVCSDSGASTGGFTDCLLQQGASKVFAIDVGYGQLAWKIRNDPRVVVMERTNIRYVTLEDLGEPLDLSVIDVSFISLGLVLPVVKTLLKPTGQVLCLIKPQFEAGKDKVGKKGVVRDPAVHEEVLQNFISLAKSLDFTIRNLTFSPVKGPEGNIEFLAHLSMQPGEDSYLAILDAGVNWYEAKTDFDLILESGNVLCFTITPLTGENIMDKTVTLDGLPERPRCTTRLRIHAEMTAIHTLTLEITDMGFGELFKSSGRAWTHTLQV